MPDTETWTFPVSLGADQAPHFVFDEPIRHSATYTWLDKIREGLVNAWCIVTDEEVLGPYETAEEADELLSAGLAGDLFQMRYK